MGVIRAAVMLAGMAWSGAAVAQVEFRDCARAPDVSMCRIMQSDLRDALPNAKRDYQAMRNVAYCLWTGCDGASAVNRKSSCDIRRAVMKMHPKKVDRNDEMHFANCVNAGF